MRLSDFSDLCRSAIKALSGYNGKVLCQRYDPKKHEELGKREVISCWAEVRATKSSTYNSVAVPIVCVFVDGRQEYEADAAMKGGEHV